MKVNRILLPFAMSLAAISCAPRQDIRVGELVNPGDQVLMQVLALRQGQEAAAALPVHGRLRSGDRFAVAVETQRPIYFVLLRRAAGDRMELLFPDSTQNQLPSASLRMPTDSSFYLLDQNAGEEDLRLVASTKALDESQAIAAARSYDQGGRRGDPPSPSPAPPPPPPPAVPSPSSPPPVLTEGNRLPTTVRSQLGADGLVILPFSFIHE